VGAVITTAPSTVIVIVPEMPTPPCESVILAVKLYEPGAAEDEIVPLIVPVPVVPLRPKPVGRFPELTAQVNGPTPPLAEMLAEYADPAAPTVVSVPEEEIVSLALMVMLRLAVAVWGGVAESVAVTVNANVPLAVGVPEITPAVLRFKPVGRLPVVTPQV